MKPIKYFLEAFLVYLFFFFGKIIGIKISRYIFSFLFKRLGPLVRSNTVIIKNLENFSNDIQLDDKNKIISGMWSNYGMTFIEYIF